MPSRDAEWHFQNGDVADKTAKPGDKRIIVTPVEVTSKDKNGTRYRQTGAAQAPPPIPLRKGFNFQEKMRSMPMPKPLEPEPPKANASTQITVNIQIPVPQAPKPEPVDSGYAETIRRAHQGPLPTTFDTLVEDTILGARPKRRGITIK